MSCESRLEVQRNIEVFGTRLSGEKRARGLASNVLIAGDQHQDSLI